MKRYNPNRVTSLIGAPIKKGTMNFLQDANMEIFLETLKTIYGNEFNENGIYRLYGAQIDNAVGVATVTKGAIYYNGEIYQVDAATSSTLSNIGLTISTTQFTTNADPVTMSDGLTIYNLHDIRKIKYFDGTASLPLPDGYLKSSNDLKGTLNQPDFKIIPSLNNSVITFENDKVMTVEGSSPSINRVYLDPSTAKNGKNIKLYAYGIPGATISIIGTASSTVVLTGDVRDTTTTYIGPNGYILLDMTYANGAGWVTDGVFVVNASSQQYREQTAARPVTSFYQGTFQDHSTNPIKYTIDSNRVYMSGRIDNSAGLSYNTGVTASFMILPVNLRPKKDILGSLCGNGDLTYTVGSPIFAKYQFMTCNIYASSGLVQLVGPFTDNLGFFKLEWDVRI